MTEFLIVIFHAPCEYNWPFLLFSLVFKGLFICISVHTGVYLRHLFAGAHGVQKRVLDPLELELQDG